jgi:Xaa-Pro aminopeptidase
VNGKFSPREREIYQIVLDAQKAVIAAIKPGLPMSDMTKIARDYINSHGKDLHGNTLGKYLPHGVSHHVGLDVHDASVPQANLAEGMVVTVEPGIYIPEENIGVRIEDVILVTEKGAKVLSAALPREPDEVEKAMAR